MIRKPVDRPRPPVRAADMVAQGWSLRELAYLRRIGALLDVDDLQALREPLDRCFTAESVDAVAAKYRPCPERRHVPAEADKLIHRRPLADTDRRW